MRAHQCILVGVLVDERAQSLRLALDALVFSSCPSFLTPLRTPTVMRARTDDSLQLAPRGGPGSVGVARSTNCEVYRRRASTFSMALLRRISRGLNRRRELSCKRCDSVSGVC